MRALSLKEANTIIAATFAAAKKHKCRPMSAIILDAGGRKLSKSTLATSLRDLRAGGATPADIRRLVGLAA